MPTALFMKCPQNNYLTHYFGILLPVINILLPDLRFQSLPFSDVHLWCFHVSIWIPFTFTITSQEFFNAKLCIALWSMTENCWSIHNPVNKLFYYYGIEFWVQRLWGFFFKSSFTISLLSRAPASHQHRSSVFTLLMLGSHLHWLEF